jgi:hypothetical protein
MRNYALPFFAVKTVNKLSSVRLVGPRDHICFLVLPLVTITPAPFLRWYLFKVGISKVRDEFLNSIIHDY